MKKYTRISAKIPVEDRKEIRKYELNPTLIIGKTVQDEIKKARNKELIAEMKNMPPTISKLTLDEIVSDIRESGGR